MILQEVLDVLQMAANAGFAQTEVMLSINNKTNEKIKGVDLIMNADSNKIVFSNGETLKIFAVLTKYEKISLTISGIFFTSAIMKGTTIKDFFNYMHHKKSVVD